MTEPGGDERRPQDPGSDVPGPPVSWQLPPEPTAEPAAPEPVASEPVASEPVASAPVAGEPAAPEPVASEPVAPEPVAPSPAQPNPYAPPPPPLANYGPPAAPAFPAAPQPGYGQPQGGYGQPEQPGYGQPQPGYGQPRAGYGQPRAGYAAPVQQPSYALPPETSEAILVSDAYNWGWTRAWRNAGGIILGALLYVIALAIVLLVFASIFGFFASSTLDPYGYGNDSGPAPFLVLLFAAIASLLGVVVQAGIIRGALEISHGRPVTIATFWTFKDFGRVFLAILLVGGLTAVGTLLFVIPGVLFAFFAQFTLYFVIDKGVRPWDALVASVQLVNRRIGTIVTLYLGTEFASLLGVLVCYVGIIVTWPVSILATTWVYRRMLGERVSG